MDEKLSRERILNLLSDISDLKIGANKSLSEGLDPLQEDDEGNILLSREELERLLSTQNNINIYAFHSSGVTNAGTHSSS